MTILWLLCEILKNKGDPVNGQKGVLCTLEIYTHMFACLTFFWQNEFLKGIVLKGNGIWQGKNKNNLLSLTRCTTNTCPWLNIGQRWGLHVNGNCKIDVAFGYFNGKILPNTKGNRQ